MPVRCVASPLPPSVHSPSTKSVAGPGTGSGFQRSRFGSGTAWLKGAVRIVPLPERVNAGCAADGRIRYSHDRRLCALGSVNAVPLSCSAYRPNGARCGEFRPSGSAPATASEACSLPKPDR